MYESFVAWCLYILIPANGGGLGKKNTSSKGPPPPLFPSESAIGIKSYRPFLNTVLFQTRIIMYLVGHDNSQNSPETR